MERDESEPGFLDPRAHAVQEPQLPERRRHDALVGQLLDLVQQRFAALGIELAGLLDEEVVHVGIAAEGVEPVPEQVVLDPGGGVALPARARST